MKSSPYTNYRHRSLVDKTERWVGYWITSHRFYHLPSSHKFGHDRKPEFNSEIQNIHTLFRKTFTAKDTDVKCAKLYITGDDLYKLYLNSEFVGEGPAQSYPFAYNYNCYDVTDLIKPGANTIGVHLYYQGLFNIYLLSADNLSGMIAQLEITYEDGSREVIASDRGWKYTECTAYTSKYLYGYQTQFSEDIDFGKIPRGWLDFDCDDTAWDKAIVCANPYPTEYSLLPQITPTVEHRKVYPTKIKKIEGGYFYDFGKEVTGSPVFEISGVKGDKIELRFGEELLLDGRVRFELRANCTYKDVHTLSGDKDLVEYFDYKGYRYLEILGVSENFNEDEVYTLCRHYPFPQRHAAFECSDERMNKIWDICVQGVKIGTQDTYYDCPTREKGGFVGDALISGLSHLILTGDTRIYKKFINDCKNTSRYCPAIMAHLPSYDINFCADYSALIPLFLEEYYNCTGDVEFLRDSVGIAEGIWEYFSEFLGDDMLLHAIKHMDKVPPEMNTILVDWPQNLRDGYDMESAERGVCTSVNIFFYGFHKTMEKLYGILGDKEKSEKSRDIHEAMGKALIEYTYDEESGLFRDSELSTHSALHANALAIFYKLTPPRGYEPLVNLIMKRRLNCGVYFAYFVMRGLFGIGKHKEALNLLCGEDEHSWVNMLRCGASTCMEAWGPDQKWNTSWCHPWSSSPIYFYTSEIMGIKRSAPGKLSFKISPKLDGRLDFAKISLPLPDGTFTASFKKCDGGYEYRVEAPKSVEVIFEGEGISFTRV